MAPSGSCDRRPAAWPLLLRTHTVLIEVLENELQKQKGLSLAWFEVLVRLQDADDGRMRMQDLAESVLLSKSGLTRLIDRMEEAGLVERTIDERDRRVVYATLTRLGRKEFDAAAPLAFGGVQRHFSACLTQNEMRVLESALQKILTSTDRSEDRTF